MAHECELILGTYVDYICNVLGPRFGGVEEAENFAVVQPAYRIPFGGLGQAIGWSRTRGEAAQKELIGVTAEDEYDVSWFSTYGAAKSSTALRRRRQFLVQALDRGDNGAPSHRR
jgi:hypothetical protein